MLRVVLFLVLLPLALKALSLEEKIGQLFIVRFVTMQEAEELISKTHVGGFIFYNWDTELSCPEEVKELTSHLSAFSKKPLFLAIDQEGGPVRRLKGDQFPFTPSNKECGDPEKAFIQAETIAKMLKDCGINMNFAPVIDISEAAGINPERCYGKDPFLVASCGRKALAAYKAHGILSTLKHFPGHGSVAVDSHEALPVQTKTFEELLQSDLIPFALLARQADAVMTSHVIIQSLDSDHPTTFSAPVLNILRQQLHFDGVIITDSISMSASTLSYTSLEESCRAALEAGCDLLLFGGKNLNNSQKSDITTQDILQAHQFLVSAVQAGLLSEERIDQSIERVLKLKKQL